MKLLHGVIFGLSMALSAPASAGLLGDNVDMSVPSQPDQNGVLVDGSVEGDFNFGSDESIYIDVDDTSITITVEDFTGFWLWETDPVTVTISDLDFGSLFSISTSEAVNALGPIIWNYGADWVSASFAGSVDVFSFPSSTILEIRADLVPAGVPEPATFALLGFGILGLGVARRRRSQK